MKKSQKIYQRHRRRILNELRELTEGMSQRRFLSRQEKKAQETRKWNMMLTLSTQNDDELDEIFYAEFQKQYEMHAVQK